MGGFSFILVQLVLIVDFAHNWADAWVGNYEESESRGWFVALFGATLLQYIISLVGIILLFSYYTQSDDCALNKFFISFNMILCLAVSLLSIHPKVQEAQPRSGLLQSAVVTLYTVFLTWSAVANNPDGACNPGLLGIINDKSKVSVDKTSLVGMVLCKIQFLTSFYDFIHQEGFVSNCLSFKGCAVFCTVLCVQLTLCLHSPILILRGKVCRYFFHHYSISS